MKVKLLFLLLPMLFSACRTAALNVQEISPNLELSKVAAINPGVELRLLSAYAEHLFVQLKSGQMLRLAPEKEALLVTLPEIFTPDVPLRQYGKFLLLGPTVSEDDYLLFDLESMKTVAGFSLEPKTEVLFCSGNKLLVRREDRLLIIPLDSRQEVEIAVLPGGPVVDVFGNSFQILILTRDKLIVHELGSGGTRERQLSLPAASAGLLHGDSLYYGADSRHLVKLNWRSGKQEWRRLLPERLTGRPVFFAGYLVFLGRDNNVYYFRENGNLTWWHPLNSQLQYGPLVMSENLVFLTMNGRLHFTRPGERKIQHLDIDHEISQSPLVLDGRVFLLALGEEKQREVWQVGNRVELQVKMEPQHLKLSGRSLRLELNYVNLVQPRTRLSIMDASGKPVLERTLEAWDNPVLAFVPQSAGRYEILLEVEALNRRLERRISFTVHDPLAPTRDYLIRLQRECRDAN